jgi:hypothetical protein
MGLFDSVSQTTGMDTSSVGATVAVVFVALTIVFVIVYLYLRYKAGKNNYITFASEPIYLKKMTDDPYRSSNKIPTLMNGNEFTYAFWFYLQSVPNTAVEKTILRRKTVKTTGEGESATTETIESPIISMPAQKNQMDFKLRMSNADVGTTCTDMTMSIDYIPLQRWVHIAIAVSSDYAVIYVDGEIYRVKSISQEPACATANLKGFAGTEGNLILGTPDTPVNAADGAISRGFFSNYFLSIEKVRELYAEGPYSKSFLRKAGIPVYGVRNPFYKVDEINI